MVAVSVLSAFIGVVAVAFECEVAALVFLGGGLRGRKASRVTWGMRGLVGDTSDDGSPFKRVPFFSIFGICASENTSKAEAAARLHAAVSPSGRCPLPPTLRT
jgi:hypothetical protein